MITDQISIPKVTNEELQTHLMSELQKRYLVELSSNTVDKMEFTAGNGGKKTNVQILRSIHRPFVLQLKVDHKLSMLVGKYNRFRNSQTGRKRNNSMFSRSFFFMYIIISVVGTILFTLLNLFFPTRDQKLLFVVALTFIIIAYFVLKSPLQKIKDKNLDVYDQQVLQSVKTSLERLSEGILHKNKKCWKCFEELTLVGAFCENCGAENS